MVLLYEDLLCCTIAHANDVLLSVAKINKSLRKNKIFHDYMYLCKHVRNGKEKTVYD